MTVSSGARAATPGQVAGDRGQVARLAHFAAMRQGAAAAESEHANTAGRKGTRDDGVMLGAPLGGTAAARVVVWPRFRYSTDCVPCWQHSQLIGAHG